MQLIIIEINFLHSHPLGPKLSTADIAKYLNIDEEFAIQMIHKYKSAAVWKTNVTEIETGDDKNDALKQVVNELLNKVTVFEEKFRMEKERRGIMQKTVDQLTEKINRFEDNMTEDERESRQSLKTCRQLIVDKNIEAKNMDARNVYPQDELVTEADILKENAKLTAATIQQKFTTLSDRIDELKVVLDACEHKCHELKVAASVSEHKCPDMVKTADECTQEFIEKLKEKFGNELSWRCSYYDDKETITEDEQRKIINAISCEARFKNKILSIFAHHINFNYTMDISMQNIKLDLEETLNTKVKLYRPKIAYNPPRSYCTNRPYFKPTQNRLHQAIWKTFEK